jgi:hypothetical protein
VSMTVASGGKDVTKEEEEECTGASGGRIAEGGRDNSDSRSGDSAFEDLYGEGRVLECESPTGTLGSRQRVGR